MLDNGAAEEVTFGPKHLLTLADHIKANELIVPDVLFDTDETIAEAMKFSRYAKPFRDDGKPLRYMGVIQGSNMSEFIKCLHSFLEMPAMSYMTTIGIPRLMTTATDEVFARVRLGEYILRHGLDAAMEFHFLGATEQLYEATWIAETLSEMARGIDTSAPIYMGLANRPIDSGKFSDRYIPRPDGYFDTSTDTPMVKYNIDVYLEWTKYDYNRPSD